MADLVCNFCGTTSEVINYHQRTFYVNDSDNWVNACPDCKMMNDDYWDDMWNEYYSGCM
jgi:hypothetical protein